MSVNEEELDDMAAGLAPRLAAIADYEDARFISVTGNLNRHYQRNLMLPHCHVCNAFPGKPCDTGCRGRHDSGWRTPDGYIVSISDVVALAKQHLDRS